MGIWTDRSGIESSGLSRQRCSCSTFERLSWAAVFVSGSSCLVLLWGLLVVSRASLLSFWLLPWSFLYFLVFSTDTGYEVLNVLRCCPLHGLRKGEWSPWSSCGICVRREFQGIQTRSLLTALPVSILFHQFLSKSSASHLLMLYTQYQSQAFALSIHWHLNLDDPPLLSLDQLSSWWPIALMRSVSWFLKVFSEVE